MTSRGVSSRRLPPLAKFRGRHFVTDQDYTRQELTQLLELAIALKALSERRRLTPFLAGRTLAMIFEHPSTRTRVSFEAAMTELGGHAQYLRPGEIHLPGRESIKDTARVLSRLCDAIAARTAFHSSLVELAEHATVPVINGLTDDYDHPVQSMTDALTILEHAGRLEGLTLAFLGKGNDAMTNSVVLTCTRLGVNVVVGAPPEAQPAPEIRALAGANCASSGATLAITDDPVEAVKDADFVYTCLWWWLHSEEEKTEIRRLFQAYQVNEALWAETKPGAKFMHCLPAIRGEEVTDAVLDGPASIVLDQVENRKHFEKALLLALIGIDELPSETDLQEMGRALLSEVPGPPR
jgi:putrescine carbamoyltransferase